MNNCFEVIIRIPKSFPAGYTTIELFIPTHHEYYDTGEKAEQRVTEIETAIPKIKCLIKLKPYSELHSEHHKELINQAIPLSEIVKTVLTNDNIEYKIYIDAKGNAGTRLD